MSALTRRKFLTTGAATAALAVTGTTTTKAINLSTTNNPIFRFVSAPDFLNADIGDVGITPNSTNTVWETQLDAYLTNLASETPAFVLVAGDLVEGHWYKDTAGVARFGPVGNLTEKKAAIRAAGELYYAEWVNRFDSHGLTVHAAIGDHEIGDNPWPSGWDKTKSFQTFKTVWSDYFTRPGGIWKYPDRPRGTWFEKTAYGFGYGNAYFLTVDVFSTNPNTGEVEARMKTPQLDWLENRLNELDADPMVDHVIVQGHVPVLGPVNYERSSNLGMEDGASSPFWKLLECSQKANVYLCGEVHAVDMLSQGGVTQLSHGALLGRASQASYLIGEVYEDRVEYAVKQAPQTVDWSSGKLWATDEKKGPAAAWSVGEWETVLEVTV